VTQPSKLPGLIFIGSIALFSACGNRAARLPDYGRVPEFRMTDSQGQFFDSKELFGKVWVADFIYTNCPGPCPRMTSQMHRLQRQLKDQPDVRLVSISVDPEHDTPDVLNNFAHRFGGPTNQWLFLTGPPAAVHLLAFTTFHVGDVIGKMDHSTKFALVDKRGEIRGYYSLFDPDGMATLKKDIAALRDAG
jgi:protein SCO1